MNKRYIDFVPAKTTNGGGSGVRRVSQELTPRRATRTAKPTVKISTDVRTGARSRGDVRPVARARVQSKRTAPRVRVVQGKKAVPRTILPTEVAGVSIDTPANAVKIAARSAGLSTKPEPVLGVVEDLNRHFVNTDVPKRPLSQKPEADYLAEAKAQKIGNGRRLKVNSASVEKPVENSVNTGANETFKTPSSPFINQGKVEKRPLSKNVYRQAGAASAAPKSAPTKAPVAIVSKPEKESRVGAVIAIIVTIILGAAAGTVAFLLLPK